MFLPRRSFCLLSIQHFGPDYRERLSEHPSHKPITISSDVSVPQTSFLVNTDAVYTKIIIYITCLISLKTCAHQDKVHASDRRFVLRGGTMCVCPRNRLLYIHHDPPLSDLGGYKGGNLASSKSLEFQRSQIDLNKRHYLHLFIS